MNKHIELMDSGKKNLYPHNNLLLDTPLGGNEG